MKKNLLILMTLCISIIGYSQTVGDTFIFSNIAYEITSLSPNRVEVTDYNTAGGTDVVIPNSVTPNSSGRVSGSANTNNRMAIYTVTSIGNSAFLSKGLTSLFIPPNVTSIGNTAFAGNNLSALLTIPDSVTSIGNQSFSNSGLTSVILGTGLISIGGNAFDGNISLTCVNSKATTAPTIVTGNGDTFGVANRANIDLLIPVGTNNSYVAASWTGFNSFQAGLGLNSQFSVNNMRYKVTSVANSTVSVVDYDISGGIVVNIPSTVIGACTSEVFSVTGIADFAFGNLFTLTSVAIPDSVTSIGNNAFSSSGISSINIPNMLTSIGNNTFANNNLTSITIPNSVLSIGDGAFNGNDLATIDIPNSVISIGNFAFGYNACSSLIIPNSVETIGYYAFRNITELTTVALGNGITSIGYGAFLTCPNLNSVTSLAITPPTITTGGTADTFGNNRNDIDLTIPTVSEGPYVTDVGALWTGFNSVTGILVVGDPLVSDYISYEVISSSSGRMQNAVEVTDYDTLGGTVVSIPSTITYNTITYDVTSIRNQAFQGKSLTDVTIPDSVTNIGLQAFTANPLTDVRSLAITPPTITTGTNDTFILDRSNIHLHIPANTMGAYVTDAGALWTGFNPVTEDASLSISDFELANDIKVISTANEIKVISASTVNLQSYELYSITGAKVSNGIDSVIPTTTLANGIYILKLDFAEGTVVKKIAK